EHPTPVDFGFEMFAVICRRNWKNCSLANSHDPALAKILRLAFDKKHSPGADQQEAAENVENEIEPIYEFDPDPDHDSAHHQRADDSPDQRAMLRHPRDLEVLKDDNEDEDVVDAERVLDHVTGEKFEPFCRAADFPDQEIEQQR